NTAISLKVFSKRTKTCTLYNSQLQSGVESFVIFDEERGHYILMRLGWHERRRVRQMILYVRLRNEKFWVEEDWTEDGIATELLKAVVPKDDIVLAFHPPKTWSLSE